jgi:hypothetical protein
MIGNDQIIVQYLSVVWHFLFLRLIFVLFFCEIYQTLFGFVFSACRNSARTGAGSSACSGWHGRLSAQVRKIVDSRRNSRARFCKIGRFLPVLAEKSVKIEVKNRNRLGDYTGLQLGVRRQLASCAKLQPANAYSSLVCERHCLWATFS